MEAAQRRNRETPPSQTFGPHPQSRLMNSPHEALMRLMWSCVAMVGTQYRSFKRSVGADVAARSTHRATSSRRPQTLIERYCVGTALLACLLPASTTVAAQPSAGGGYGSMQVVRGAASSLSIGRDGGVWAVDPAGLLYVRAVAGTSWSARGGDVSRVAAIDQDGAWLLSAAGELSLLSAGNRRSFPAPIARDVSVGIDGTVALVSVAGALLAGRDGQWIDANFPHGLAQSVVLDEHVLPWVINEEAALYRFDGTAWQAVASGARGVSIGSSGSVMLTEIDGRTSVWNVPAQRFSAVAGLAELQLKATAITPNGDLWSVGGSGEIFVLAALGATRQDAARPPATFTRLLQWRTMRGRAGGLSVSPTGQVFAVDTEGNAHRYQGRGVWSLIPGQFTAMAGALDQSLWALRTGGQLMRRVRGVWSDVAAMPLAAIAPAAIGGGLWALSADGGVMRLTQPELNPVRIAAPPARQISVDEANQLWLLDFNGDLWKSASSNSNGATDLNWSRVGFGGLKAKSIAGGARQSAYVVATNNDIYWFDPREGLFKPANGRASAVALGPRDALWALTPDGNILASLGALAAETTPTEMSSGAANTTPELSRPAVVNFVGRADTTRKALQFRAVDGTAGDIGVSSGGAVFATGIESGVACFSSNLQKFLPVVSGAARRVSIAPDRDTWVVDVYGRVATIKAATGVATPATPITATDVSVAADGTVYLVGTDERVFRRSTADGAFEPLELRANGFALGGYRIAAVSRNVFWLANKSAGLWRCNGGACSAQNVTAKDISVGPEGSVFVVDASGNLQRQITGLTAGALGSVGSFARVGQGGVANVSVGPQGLPWIVTTAGKVLTAEPLPQATLGRQSINDFCQSLAAAATNGSGASLGASALPLSPPIITIIARPDSVTLGRGGSVDLLANDSLGNARADASGNVRFQVQSNELPAAAISATGVVTIPGNQSPGTFAVRYSICAAPLGQPCASTVASIRVTAPPFVANAGDDAVTLARGGAFNLLANDSVDGRVVVIGGNAAFAVVSSTLPTTAVRDGVVSIALDQAPGSYVVSYQLCGLIAGQSCVSATARIAVSPPNFVATAADDTASLLRGASFDLLANDRVNGAPVLLGSNARFVLVSSTLPALSVASGRVTIAADQALGGYALRYQLCGLIAGQSCVEASATITVIVQPFVAVVNPESVTLWARQSVNLLGNDTVNGGPVQLGTNARLNVTSSTLPVSAAGTVIIGESQPLGVYSMSYQLCGLIAGQGCVGTTSTITVIVQPFVAVVNPESVTLWAGQSVNLLGNDTVNGGPVQLGTNARLNVTASTLPVSAAGTVSIGESQPLGVYSVSYQLCGLIAGQGCVGTTSTITVVALPFVAVVNPENVTLRANEGVNLLANDLVNGDPVALGTNARFELVSTTLPAGAVSQFGFVFISASVPVGSYPVAYRLCGPLPGQNCVGTTSLITVVLPPPPFFVVVNPDNVTLQPGQSVNLLANDSVDGGPVLPGRNAGYQTLATTLPASAISSVGVVTIPAAQAAGVYSVSYRLCGLILGQGCLATTSTITVALAVPPFVAVVNPDNVSLQVTQTVNLLSNDTVSGGAVVLGTNASFNVISTTLPASSVSAVGVVTVPAAQPLGTYTVNYRLCGLLAGQTCVQTTSIITVVAPTLVAVADVSTIIPGGTLNLLANDSLNGAVPLSAQVNVTFNTASAFLSQSGGVVTLAAGAPPGSTQTATYSICPTPANTPCSGPVNVTINVPSVITAVADAATLSPSGTLNLLANDSLNGTPPLSSQVAVTFNTASAFLSQTGGVLTLAAGSPTGTTQTATYSICQSPANTPCSGPVNVTITVPSSITAVADTATVSPNGTLNLLANDVLNGAAPLSSQVAVTFNTASALLAHAGGVVTVDPNAPSGSIQTATYSICQSPSNTPCSGTVNVTISVPSVISAAADAGTLAPGGTLNLLSNDFLNGAAPLPAQVVVTFNTASAHLSQVGGLLTLAAGAPAGTTQTASYSICKTPTNAPCSATVAVTITVPNAISAVADVATVNPGGTLNLLANDFLNGSTPLASQVAVTFNTAFPAYLSQTGGVLTLSPTAFGGNTLLATYSICQLPANAPCSGPVNVTITVTSSITAVADTATVSPGGTLNLFANDLLNGDAPMPGQVTVTFNTASLYLTQTNGIVTLAAGAPAGATQTATYRICVPPANTTCSATVAVSVTAPITAIANPDGPVILTRGIGAGIRLHLNDRLRGVLVPAGGIVFPPGPVNVQYTLNNNTATFVLSAIGYLQLLDDMFAIPGIYTLSYTFCEAGVPTNCSSTTATINVQAP